MEPTKELIDQLYREEVLRARAMRPEERLLMGLRLFDAVYRRMSAGVSNELPDADESRIEDIVRDRLRLARRLEEST